MFCPPDGLMNALITGDWLPSRIEEYRLGTYCKIFYINGRVANVEFSSD